jgi:hypothetical protein
VTIYKVSYKINSSLSREDFDGLLERLPNRLPAHAPRDGSVKIKAKKVKPPKEEPFVPGWFYLTNGPGTSTGAVEKMYYFHSPTDRVRYGSGGYEDRGAPTEPFKEYTRIARVLP